MGFFANIKRNPSHGSVKVAMLAPAQTEKGQATIHIQAIVTAAGAPQTINSVTAAIEVDDLGNPTDNTIDHPRTSVLARQAYAKPFQLVAEQSASLSFDIPLNPTTTGQGQAAAGGHYIKVSANVDGIAIDPSARQHITLDGTAQPKPPS